MVRLSVRSGIVASLVVLLCSTAAFAQLPPPPAANPAGAAPGARQTGGQGLELLRHAADAQKYLFLFFYQTDDEQTRSLRGVFETTMGKVTDRAESAIVSLANPSQKALVSKFGADRAPMPMVLALAPNGAVTGGYPLKFDEQLLMSAFCSRSTWESLKALQDGKLVFFCIQHATTRFGPEALKAVQDVKADAQYAKLTEIVTIDPLDAAEADALKRLNIDPKTNEAVTILIAPPATIVNRFQGAVTKEAIIAEIKKAAAGKGGCCPGGRCGPRAPVPGAGPGAAAAAAKPRPDVAAGKAPPGAPVPQQRPGTPATKP